VLGLRHLAALFALGLVVMVAPVSAVSSGSVLPGSWHVLPRAPIGLIDQSPVSVWAGRQLMVFGRVTTSLRGEPKRVYVGAAYSPSSRSWRRLPSPPKSADGIYGYNAVWTGKEMLVWGQGIGIAFDPARNRWRQLPASPMDGAALVVWTGRELIGWGGGCCGDAWSNGAAYNPATNSWRTLPDSPLHGAQGPVGAWTGRELVILVGGTDPASGKPWPASLARAAAYNPKTNTWRRIALPPATRDGATAIWDGRDLLLIGGYLRSSPSPLPWKLARTLYAYDPTTNHWRQLAAMPSARRDFATVWTGKQLLVWAGTTDPGGGGPLTKPESPPRGFAYSPMADRWSALPNAPLRGRMDPTAVWTGRSLIVWGGGVPLPPYRSFTDGALFTPVGP
jgi:N-acetylneuraminic acid mutarotase